MSPIEQTPNPDLVATCGMRTALVLDASGSITNAAASDEVMAAAHEFLGALADTGSTVGVVNFHSNSAIGVDYERVTGASIADGGIHWAAIAGVGPHTYTSMVSSSRFRGTNWEAALRSTQVSVPPHLVVLVTDGAPSAWLDADGQVVEGPDSVEGLEQAFSEAFAEAESLRSSGTHLLAVAVGSNLTGLDPTASAEDQPRKLQMLTRIAEPDAARAGFYDHAESSSEAATYEAATDDVVLVDDFTELGQQLRTLAVALCDTRAEASSPSLPPAEALAASTGEPLPRTGVPFVGVVIVGAVIAVSGAMLRRWAAGSTRGTAWQQEENS